MMHNLKDRYFTLLKLVVASGDVDDAVLASTELMGDIVKQKVLIEDVVDAHFEALVRLGAENPALTLGDVAEVTMAYGEAIRGHLQQSYTERKECPPCAYTDINARRAQATRLDAIGGLAEGIAHDFNTILGIINGYAELLGDTLAPDSGEYKQTQRILGACARARALILRMQAFARQKPAHPVPLEAVGVIREILGMTRKTLPAGIDMHIDSDLPAAFMMADALQISQILMHLCENAVDAILAHGRSDAPGRLDIRIGAAPQADQDAARRRFTLAIGDNGGGMPIAVQQRIFDPFYTTKEPGKGSGLGLSAVYGIVADLGGEINVITELGAGSTFIVELPLLTVPPQHAQQKKYRTLILKETF